MSLPNVCLICGGQAAPFDADGVPEVLDFLQGRIQAATLRQAVRDRVTKQGCAIAPRSGVSVCAQRKKVS